MQDPFQSAASNEPGRISYLYLPDVRGQEGDEKLNEEGTKNRTKKIKESPSLATITRKTELTHTRARARARTHLHTNMQRFPPNEKVSERGRKMERNFVLMLEKEER